jgi:sulfite oxidase
LNNYTQSDAQEQVLQKTYPVYRKSDVANHVTKDKGIWVTYKDGVFDITKFISNHPGGKDKIMLAAGKDIGPFWNVYQQHLNSKLPLELLENMRIGTLHPDDVAAEAQNADTSDPYAKDPLLSPLMIYTQRKPINAELPGFLLTDSWITPKEAWFVRNHHPVAHIDERDFKLTLDLSCAVSSADSTATSLLSSPTLTLEDLKTKYKPTSIVSTIQCGGNRRAGMNAKGTTLGNLWGIGAISNARWTGALLRDVLLSSGLTEDDLDERANPLSPVRHVVFVAQDGMEVSIPIHTAISRYGDVLLAYEMNGEPLTAQHGFPLRLIAPGHSGVRNAKWLAEIRLSSEEAKGPWQRGIAYKGFGPSVSKVTDRDVDSIPTMLHPPVQSAVTVPRPDSSVVAGETFTAQGYAYSGGGRGIIRVDVSADGGRSWTTASLGEGSQQPLHLAWGWTFWEAEMPAPAVGVDDLEVICKATDASYNVQPDSVEGIWNLRGINNNAWHRVGVKVVAEEEASEDEEEDQ